MSRDRPGMWHMHVIPALRTWRQGVVNLRPPWAASLRKGWRRGEKETGRDCWEWWLQAFALKLKAFRQEDHCEF